MSDLELYLRLGFSHILDWQGYDHMLFLLAMAAVYRVQDWRRLAVQVTAFTLGHSLTLALVAAGVVPHGAVWVEAAIAGSILVTALANLYRLREEGPPALPWVRYALALVFGLVHGMGFSSYFLGLLGDAPSVVRPLLYFNVGIECGQLLFVAGIAGLSWAAQRLLRVQHWHWRLGTSLLAAAVAAWMVWDRVL